MYPFLEALKRQNKGRIPLWIMRQAGRYLPEYRAIREKRSFLELCHTPELAAEVTLLPLKRYDLDAAILFSDILVLIEAMGAKLSFLEKEGPVIANPYRGEPLHKARPLTEVFETIRLLKPSLKVPLIGFSGAPFTLASYWIQGRSSKDWSEAKNFFWKHPKEGKRLIQALTDEVIAYLKGQIEAGVDAVQLFESWGQILGFEQFHELSLKPIQQIVEALRPTGVPVIVYSKAAAGFAEEIAACRPSAISVDWNCSLATVRKRVGKEITIQGNLDPMVLYQPHDVIRREVEGLLKQVSDDPAYIFNLGHGILPDVSPDAVQVLVESVHAKR